jgi:hypothetical protein
VLFSCWLESWKRDLLLRGLDFERLVFSMVFLIFSKVLVHTFIPSWLVLYFDCGLEFLLLLLEIFNYVIEVSQGDYSKKYVASKALFAMSYITSCPQAIRAACVLLCYGRTYENHEIGAPRDPHYELVTMLLP